MDSSANEKEIKAQRTIKGKAFESIFHFFFTKTMFHKKQGLKGTMNELGEPLRKNPI